MSSTSMQGSAMTYAMVGRSPAEGCRGLGAERARTGRSLPPGSWSWRAVATRGGTAERQAVGVRRTAPARPSPSRSGPGCGSRRTRPPSAAASAGTVQTTSTRSPGPDHDPDAVEARAAAATNGVGPGGCSATRGLGVLPRGLRRAVADDRLVGVETAVDHVEQHGLPRDEVDGRRDVRVVAGDDVDLARGRARAGRDRRGRRGRRLAGAITRGRAHGGRPATAAAAPGESRAWRGRCIDRDRCGSPRGRRTRAPRTEA